MAEFDTYKEKSLREIQKELDTYISQFQQGYFPPMSQMVRLSEEVGELAREVMDQYGEKKKKAEEPSGSIEEELTDVFVVILLLANSLNIDLTANFEKNLEKFYARDSYRFPRRESEEQSEDK